MSEVYEPKPMTAYRQTDDGRWELAKPLVMPWHVRLTVWWHRTAKPWLKGLL